MAAPDREHLRRLERMYAGAPVNRWYRSRLTVGEGTAELVIPVRDEFFHAAGAVHGSVYFKALDDAAYFAASSLVEESFVVTSSFHLHLVRPASAGELKARGRVLQRSRRLIVAEARLEDERGRLLASGSGSFLPSGVALGPELGYE